MSAVTVIHRLFLTLVAAMALSIGLSVEAARATEQATTSPPRYALVNARLVIRPGEVLERGTLLIRADRIEAVAARLRIPADAIVLDLGGRTVYPGFIDANSRYAQPNEQPRNDATVRTSADHENTLVSSARDIGASIQPDAERASKLRELGITSVLSQPGNGIFRGQAALLSTMDSSHPSEVLMVPRLAQALAFEAYANGSEQYPVSPAGSTALMRQVLLDARWQQQRQRWLSRQSAVKRGELTDEVPPALSALWPTLSQTQPVIFQADVEVDLERAARLAQELGLRWLINGNGYEYRQAAMLKASGAGVIVSLKRPSKPAVANPDEALDVSLSELQHWEWAPFNARVLAEAGVPFALTSAGLDNPATEFWPRLREAVANGLAEEVAMAALTVVPASLLGIADRVGALAPRRSADLVIGDADLFHSNAARIHEVWTRGQRHILRLGKTGEDIRNVVLTAEHTKPALPTALRYPVGEYGRESVPAQLENVLVRGATVWTQGAQGVLHDADLWVQRGRIRAVGKNLSTPAGATSVDGR
ncbi:amidohydrolase family protein, partial [Steroidobacter sp.]|uniref:amidohydrolase family protein n=1 Tax=Steroidobacter sp. TaxID=1978227 RepID=UPI001A42B1CC